MPFGYFILFSERVELTPYKDLEAGRSQLMWTLSSAPTWDLELKLVQLSNYYHCCCRWWYLLSGLLVLRASIHFKLAIESTTSVITRRDIFFIYYKVRQNRPEVRLSCEYLINILRRRFQNYYTILRVINKTLFKTRVVLNYSRKLLRLHLFFLSHLGLTTPRL